MIDFNTGKVMGFCLHRKHTRSVGEAIYRARKCYNRSHFMRKETDEEPEEKDKTVSKAARNVPERPE